MSTMRFDILTLFPELYEPHLSASVIGRGRGEGLLDIKVHDIRDYATDKHRTVDDTPYGGGAGMVLKIEPIDQAISSIKAQNPKSKIQTRTVVLSARGAQFTQAKAQEYAHLNQLVLICGRYEGIDQRVADFLADEELSIGPYVLAGGDVAAMVVLEAVARLVPGVLGNPASLNEESFTAHHESRITNHEAVEYPQYTKPAEYNGWTVPEVLLSGNHEEIKKWREEQQESA